MKAPLSWLKDYVDITLEPKKLGDKLTEVGLGTEKIINEGNDTIFELEITPNRPDCLSLIGIAHEVAAIEGKKVKYPKSKIDVRTTKPSKILPLDIKTSYKINPRFTGIIIDGIKVGSSPKWLVERLEKMGQRSINNIVDITNFVMLELGNPIHAFDYDKIKGHKMIVHQTKGGESFKSVDGISYHLPKGAVVISDSERIIDLCGIKGGENSATYENTKTIFIRVPAEVPNLIRRASQSLRLRSEASSIFERGVNAGGTIDALNRIVNLVLEIAGGEIASVVYDLKEQKFEPWKLSLRIKRLHKILGIEIPENNILTILESLNLSPKKINDAIEITVPTYRNDLKIEEDAIEEVARLYGYNNFPKTLPIGETQTSEIPYLKDYKLDEQVRTYFKANGFSEVYTYSLVSEKDLESEELNPDHVLRVDNPISREFEYLRPTLKINLKKAIKQNKAVTKTLSFFEIGKIYTGKSLDQANEHYQVFGITNEKNFFEVKGMIERLFNDFQIENLPYHIDIEDEGVTFSFHYSDFAQKVTKQKNQYKIFKPLPKYPPVIEDLALVVKPKTKIEDIIKEMRSSSTIIEEVDLLDQYGDTKTFHIIYQHPEKNLTNEYVSVIRQKILKNLFEKFGAKLKE